MYIIAADRTVAMLDGDRAIGCNSVRQLSPNRKRAARASARFFNRCAMRQVQTAVEQQSADVRLQICFGAAVTAG
jgi:hypothetical protein